MGSSQNVFQIKLFWIKIKTKIIDLDQHGSNWVSKLCSKEIDYPTLPK
jgi:hypothetical protein